MAVNIDRVYQKVLALANKEQRGYITPQEFNLLADKAQMDIFESYFHDLKTAYHKQKNDTDYIDETDIISQKLTFFETTPISSSSIYDLTNSTIDISDNLIYRIKSVTRNSREVEEVSLEESYKILNNPLTSPTKDRSIYVRERVLGKKIRIYPTTSSSETLSMTYYYRPTLPHWDYVVVNNKALYNSTPSSDFSLDPSEEEPLVTRILQLSGLIMQKPGIIEVAMTDDKLTKANQNN